MQDYFQMWRILYVLGEVLLNGGSYKERKYIQRNQRYVYKCSKFLWTWLWMGNKQRWENSGYMGKYSDEYFVGHTGFTGTQIVYWHEE